MLFFQAVILNSMKKVHRLYTGIAGTDSMKWIKLKIALGMI
jgi:hypothetical protein